MEDRVPQLLKKYKKQGGFSFVELLVTIAIVTLVFGGLFAGFRTLIVLIGQSKAQAGATALAAERMEYIRSLSYNSIGTVGGVPSGNIPQNSTTTLNGITYGERVLIQYIDDEADGFGGDDTNLILADYKQVKVEYTWTLRGKTGSVSLVSNIVPVGIETTAGGGTIRVNVFDAAVQPLEDASVRFVNDTVNPPIDTTRYTGSDGVAYLSAATATANYQIEVTKPGYSFDGTYVATTSNPNPITPPIAVVESAVSTMNFQIDQTSDLLIKTLGTATVGEFSDSFIDSSSIAASSNVTVASGAVELAQTVPGVYDLSGMVQSATTSPATIQKWNFAFIDATTDPATDVIVSVYYENAGLVVLVPDSDLPGNSAGFSDSVIDLTDLDPVTYASLALKATLSTTDTNVSPLLEEWSLQYTLSQTPEPNVSLAISGDKSIGTQVDSSPVLKYEEVVTTNASGEAQLNDLEWDVYSIDITSPGFDVLEICDPTPYSLLPDVSETITIVLDSASAYKLRTVVQNAGGDPVPLASVQLQNVGVDLTENTSLCGQAFFNSGLYAANDYTLTVSAPGFDTEVRTDVTISSTSTEEFILNEI